MSDPTPKTPSELEFQSGILDATTDHDPLPACTECYGNGRVCDRCKKPRVINASNRPAWCCKCPGPFRPSCIDCPLCDGTGVQDK